MEQREWRNPDRDLSPGEMWENEPDKIQWTDPSTGLPCLIVRNGVGALCGYVGIPESHPLFGKGYGECLAGCDQDDGWCNCSPASFLSVHGGLTFSDRCAGDPESPRSVCHVEALGEGPVWWFGFDCAHAGDYCPGGRLGSDGEYRTAAYVASECATLAAQLREVS